MQMYTQSAALEYDTQIYNTKEKYETFGISFGVFFFGSASHLQSFKMTFPS